MGKIFVIMGKSATGKDTIFKRLVEQKELDLKTVVTYTTRPIREGETNGVEYFFVNKETLLQLKESGKVIEHRAYQTIHGEWNYFTVNDGQIDLAKHDYILIGTLEAYGLMKQYYGAENVYPIYIEVEDGIRLQRALAREESQKNPKYAEMCRRFLADDEDFSEEKIQEQGITKRYNNLDIATCLEHIVDDIRKI